jgi:hypothetical protein
MSMPVVEELNKMLAKILIGGHKIVFKYDLRWRSSPRSHRESDWHFGLLAFVHPPDAAHDPPPRPITLFIWK